MSLVVRGARVHNLKNISVTLPRDKLVVLTGPSGSGKSSLAFDTIYAEGQRRYVESLSAFARQFLDQMTKPDVDSIEGLSPTISIEQRTTSYNPRSTVGTVTEIYDYLRLLYSRVGKPYCWKCGDPIRSQSQQQIADMILAMADDSKVSILSPVVKGRKGEYQKELHELRQKGFVRILLDGETVDLSDEIHLDKNKKHDISVYVDRLIIRGDRGNLISRISDSVELALKMGEGTLLLETFTDGVPQQILMSEKFACTRCQISYPSPEPRSFSFNSPAGACAECDGIGFEVLDEEVDGADVNKTEDASSLFIPKPPETCKVCNGARLRKESLHFKVSDKNIFEVCSLSISELAEYFQNLVLSERDLLVASRILKEIRERAGFLTQVGVGYLTLARSAQSLSGGEAQRIRLATQIGSALVGVIYVLDEPSIGLHQKDNKKLLDTLFRLRDMGNTVLVVEHDRDTIELADWVVDLGPGAGVTGGSVMAEGTPKQLLKSKESLTGKYLRGELEIKVPAVRRPADMKAAITISKAKKNNLKTLDVSFPLGNFICVTGPSGSGKSTLVIDTLYPALARALYKVDVGDLEIGSISGVGAIDKVIDIDQSAIGKTPRSNPATYTGLFSLIRDLFASLPESKVRGYAPGRYSFNVKGGRCDTCEGDGLTKVEMHFLPDVYVMCETCRGRRYNRETLEVRYKGKNIADVLEMTGAEAIDFFDAIPTIKTKLTVLNDVGLGYLQLGQSATTLSGGEAQRIKLAKELSRRATGRTFYILDEPTTGLHFDDIRKLIDILQRLVDQGNTVLVIEHNLDIIKVADHIIDMGPEGGLGGGRILAAGTPEDVALNKLSETGKFLRPYLNI